ncbi:hypothetical protein cypCar_00040812 [Cyprinus carpio]|nr:hypothetical protein cypCar_00040812 [Cyprinus carpio]
MSRYRHSDVQTPILTAPINYRGSIAQTLELANDGYKLYENHLIFSIPLGSKPPVKLRVYESVQEVSRHQPRGKLAQESLMNHVIKALKKLTRDSLAVSRRTTEPAAKLRLLTAATFEETDLFLFSLSHTSMAAKLCALAEGRGITNLVNRGGFVNPEIKTAKLCVRRSFFGHNGFYLVLKGSVKTFNHETLKEDQTVSTIAAGGSFGCCEPLSAVDGGAIIQCVMTLETCEILKISRSGYEKLKKDILAQDHEVKVSLIQGCQLYLHWPKLSINHLVDGMQLKTFPANQGKWVP